VLNSVSRVMPAITDADHRAAAARLRDLLATYEKSSDLINIGAYVEGSNPAIDQAIALMPQILSFLRQEAHSPTPYYETLSWLARLAKTDVPKAREDRTS